MVLVSLLVDRSISHFFWSVSEFFLVKLWFFGILKRNFGVPKRNLVDQKFSETDQKFPETGQFFFGRPKKMRKRLDNWSTKRLTKTTWTGLVYRTYLGRYLQKIAKKSDILYECSLMYWHSYMTQWSVISDQLAPVFWNLFTHRQLTKINLDWATSAKSVHNKQKQRM